MGFIHPEPNHLQLRSPALILKSGQETSQSFKVSPGKKPAFPSLTGSEGARLCAPSHALAPSANADGLRPSASIPWRSLAEDVATFLAEASRLPLRAYLSSGF